MLVNSKNCKLSVTFFYYRIIKKLCCLWCNMRSWILTAYNIIVRDRRLFFSLFVQSEVLHSVSGHFLFQRNLIISISLVRVCLRGHRGCCFGGHAACFLSTPRRTHWAFATVDATISHLGKRKILYLKYEINISIKTNVT